MKKIILLIFMLSILVNVNAQQKLPTSAEIEAFYKSKTYVVLDNNIFGMWNNAIREAVEKDWTITPFEFITPDEFKVKMKRPGASFILTTDTYFEGQKEMGLFTSLSILLGKQNGTLNTMPDIAEFPLAYENIDYDEYYYKLGLALRFVQNHIKYLKENPDESSMSVMNLYRKAKKNTKEKTLYVRKSDLAANVNTASYIKKYYSGKVKIASIDEIETVIENKDANALILHLVRPDKDIDGMLCMKMLIDAEKAELYYFDYHKIKRKKKPGAFMIDDFKSIEK